MKIKSKNPKIAIFFGGKITQHLVLVKRAAKKLGVEADFVSYNRVCFDSFTGVVKIRGEGEKINEFRDVNEFDVLFFRTTGKHWEEVDLVLSAVRRQDMVIVDPLVRYGKPSYACKAWQMLKLREAGIEVPGTVYGSLWYLYEFMKKQELSPRYENFDSYQVCSQAERNQNTVPSGTKISSKSARHENFDSSQVGNQSKRNQNTVPSGIKFSFPVIIKGSGGDRGTRVFKADNLEELERLVRDLRKSETEEGRRYMLQEYIENDGDYRVLVLGDKVLGVMKRSTQNKAEFRNNYSAGGRVEVADLPESIKQLAVRAADACGLWVAGVDVAFRDFDKNKPVIWEVNKGPQFKGFMEATGIDVPAEMIKFLVSLIK